MNYLERFPQRGPGIIDSKLIPLAVSGGLLIANEFNREALVVHANDPIGKQARLALPSALPAPVVTGNRLVDMGLQSITTAVGLEAASKTSTKRELVAMAIGAQVVSCAINAGVERTGWLSKAERAQEDVGSSAIYLAWFMKFLLDRLASAKTDHESRRWKVAAAVFAGSVTFGAYYVEGSNGGKLDMSSHLGSLMVGVVAHKLGSWRKAYGNTEGSSDLLVN